VPEADAQPTKDARQGLCGAWVYGVPRTEWAGKRVAAGLKACGHCMRRLLPPNDQGKLAANKEKTMTTQQTANRQEPAAQLDPLVGPLVFGIDAGELLKVERFFENGCVAVGWREGEAIARFGSNTESARQLADAFVDLLHRSARKAIPHCTCHERDSSYVCDFCYSQGHRGHMQR
jgi:hypothetical protein